MLFLLLTATAAGIAATGFAMRLHVAPRITATMFITGNPITRRELDFQLDYFIPLFVAPITLGH